MSIFKNVKNFLVKKEIPKIESIESYEDVNLFLKGYKYYFEKRAMEYYYEWCFIDDNNITITKIADRYYVNGFREPNIRAYVWDNRDIINAELRRKREKAENEKKEWLRKKELEDQIKMAV